ncbi:hypothetical protein OG322_25615 [Streptomyces sp. NBC_01260]|uniref:hypothetical protein n=1 Tax=unclassified Streptomyces TaxID=2593676 RepID=UPI002E33DC53|nr:hypothetical protein [Streptomyces sp. NBC_01260]
MSPRGRKAALPEGGHRRPDVLAPGKLVVRHVAEDGVKKATYDFESLPVPETLQRELAETFAAKAGPGGTWKSTASSREAWLILLYFSRFLAAEDPVPRSLSELSAKTWAAWRISRTPNSTGRRQIRKTAQMLREHPQVPEETRQLMAKRVGRDTVKEIAYLEAEFDKIKKLAGQKFRAALHRIRENRQYLQRWQDGEFAEGSEDWLVGEALDHLVRTGEIPHYTGIDDRRRPIPRYTHALGGASAPYTWMRLFLTSEEACALIVLMIATYGWNASPVVEMTVPDATPDAGNHKQTIYRVELHKKRRTAKAAYETRNLADWGANSPGRLIAQAVEATEPARQTLAMAGAPHDRLILWRLSKRSAGDGDPAELFDVGIRDNVWRNWREELGAGLNLNLRRLRKTVVIAHQRTPSQHSRDTHDTVYLLPDPRTHAEAAPVISAGISEAIDVAQAAFQARVSRAETDAGQDTPTANCTGYHDSPFGEAGSPCRASFLMCTACPNAVITPRHLPRLTYLHHVLCELKAVLEPAVWDQDWRDPYLRLCGLKAAPDFTDTEWTDALSDVTDTDKAMIDQLLQRGYDA